MRLPDSHYQKYEETEIEEKPLTVNVKDAIEEGLLKYGVISTPYLQRKCKISYKAAKEAVERESES